MSRQKAWQQKGIQNIIAYFAKSVHTQARRLERQESAEITATAELADVVDELTPESVLAAQELLEEIRHISTPTQRRIVDMLDSGCSRQEVSITLHIKKPNLRKQISDLRKRMHI
jgi:DNA-binding NarL/FixJ family response regulator